jgi:hypothetical protein
VAGLAPAGAKLSIVGVTVTPAVWPSIRGPDDSEPVSLHEDHSPEGAPVHTFRHVLLRFDAPDATDAPGAPDARRAPDDAPDDAPGAPDDAGRGRGPATVWLDPTASQLMVPGLVEECHVRLYTDTLPPAFSDVRTLHDADGLTRELIAATNAANYFEAMTSSQQSAESLVQWWNGLADAADAADAAAPAAAAREYMRAA